MWPPPALVVGNRWSVCPYTAYKVSGKLWGFSICLPQLTNHPLTQICLYYLAVTRCPLHGAPTHPGRLHLTPCSPFGHASSLQTLMHDDSLAIRSHFLLTFPSSFSLPPFLTLPTALLPYTRARPLFPALSQHHTILVSNTGSQEGSLPSGHVAKDIELGTGISESLLFKLASQI